MTRPGFIPDSISDWWSFDFERVPMRGISDGGVPYTRWVPTMPQLSPNFLKTTFYLYKSVKDARDGAPFGGTGFFVGYPDPYDHRNSYVYAVSNWHVVMQAGCSVIRVNKIGGGVDIFEFDPADWTFSPGRQDVAVADVEDIFASQQREGRLDATFITTSAFLTEELVEFYQITAGEDIFMLGRFVDHDGGDSNVPSVRFGHISVMPRKVKQPTGGTEDSYILDVHSRTGYSGSPVFVYRTAGSYFTAKGVSANPANRFVKLLGIHWGQFPERWEIKRTAEAAAAESVSADSRYVTGMSGMTLAVPAWSILSVLEFPMFKERRDLSFQRSAAKNRRKPVMLPVAEVAESTSEQESDSPESDANPDHLEDFTRLLTAAVTTKPSEDQT